MDHKGQIYAFYEATIGVILVTIPAWHEMVETAFGVAHVITAFGGAILAIHGVYRIVYRSFRRPS